jgi:hypothetical protein
MPSALTTLAILAVVVAVGVQVHTQLSLLPTSTVVAGAPATMTAAVYDRHGRADEVVSVVSWPFPQHMGPKDVVVKVVAAALNPVVRNHVWPCAHICVFDGVRTYQSGLGWHCWARAGVQLSVWAVRDQWLFRVPAPCCGHLRLHRTTRSWTDF